MPEQTTSQDRIDLIGGTFGILGIEHVRALNPDNEYRLTMLSRVDKSSDANQTLTPSQIETYLNTLLDQRDLIGYVEPSNSTPTSQHPSL